MYAYRIQADGRATDLRFVKPDYQPQLDEQTGEGDVLPDIETLHEQKFHDLKAKQEAARLIEQENGGWSRKQREWLKENVSDTKLIAAIDSVESRIVATGVRSK